MYVTGRIDLNTEEKHDNFIAAVRIWEMLAASKVKMSGSEKNFTLDSFSFGQAALTVNRHLL